MNMKSPTFFCANISSRDIDGSNFTSRRPLFPATKESQLHCFDFICWGAMPDGQMGQSIDGPVYLLYICQSQDRYGRSVFVCLMVC